MNIPYINLSFLKQMNNLKDPSFIYRQTFLMRIWSRQVQVRRTIFVFISNLLYTVSKL